MQTDPMMPIEGYVIPDGNFQPPGRCCCSYSCDGRTSTNTAFPESTNCSAYVRAGTCCEHRRVHRISPQRIVSDIKNGKATRLATRQRGVTPHRLASSAGLCPPASCARRARWCTPGLAGQDTNTWLSSQQNMRLLAQAGRISPSACGRGHVKAQDTRQLEARYRRADIISLRQTPFTGFRLHGGHICPHLAADPLVTHPPLQRGVPSARSRLQLLLSICYLLSRLVREHAMPGAASAHRHGQRTHLKPIFCRDSVPASALLTCGRSLSGLGVTDLVRNMLVWGPPTAEMFMLW